MDSQERPRPTQEKTTTVEWVLYSPHIKDIVLITPKDLNNTPVTSQYKEISAKQIQKRYFEMECPKMHQAKRRNTKLPVGKS